MPTVSEVMSRAAALLNDVNLNVFTTTAQFPYINMAIDELQELLEQNNVPYTNKRSAVLTVTTAMTDIGGTTGPALPTDLIEIQWLGERLAGTTDDFIQMTRREYLPHTQVLTETLEWYTWQGQVINFIGATTSREIRIDYIAALLTAVTATTSSIGLFNSKSFLAYRTAALCAEFIGENPTRAQALNNDAGMALDRLLSINTKGRQSITTRRRPFMAAYKTLGY